MGKNQIWNSGNQEDQTRNSVDTKPDIAMPFRTQGVLLGFLFLSS
jgi:hypothetical protein